MGQLRTTIAAMARLGCPPEEIMSQLSSVVAGHGEETDATCLYAQYDPATRRCRLTSAGHLPSALRHPEGTAEFIDVPGGVMLGVGPIRYPATDIKLPPGSVLALYTDGLIEQPGQDISTGMARLARTLSASPARSLDQLGDSVLASLGSHAVTTSPCCSPAPPPRRPADPRKVLHDASPDRTGQHADGRLADGMGLNCKVLRVSALIRCPFHHGSDHGGANPVDNSAG
jgi:Stage II sporulation protein E (SpoIIE)